MRNPVLNTLAVFGICALAGCGHAPATHVAETATARPAPLYAPAGGLPVRATHDGNFKVDATRQASAAEAKATTWAAAQHYCHGLRAQAVEVSYRPSTDFQLNAAHSIPVANMFAGSPLTYTGELTFKCTGRAS